MKTENGWVVRYDRRTLQDPSAEDGELPLLPDDLWVIDHTGYALGVKQEIEFEEITEDIVNPINKHLIKFTYAKLIHHPVDTTKMINHIVEANEMVCMFEPRTDTSSATVCKHCGQEKFLHNQVPDVRKMVSNVEIGKKRWYDWDEFNKKACYPEDHQSAFADGFTRGAKWVNEIAQETLYTEEQVREAMNCTVLSAKAKERVIQSLKQPK